ncbi:hypothetical protein phytr_10280 [Candidatus Phycorickettsia trachydisci]|uniref:Uncharacterized protein n=1 Tax=Candidatus Phycorickettsia trachydisci TaxID=2115978 RepID=A0A2P1P9M9_9RICK|nr:hypothetical protein [Candidatus Phycorickettsia trachydisci]AVP87956.1 hypothetical protein phytr_10280 [Candidatus Phycorickettsia trachydisci]
MKRKFDNLTELPSAKTKKQKISLLEEKIEEQKKIIHTQKLEILELQEKLSQQHKIEKHKIIIFLKNILEIDVSNNVLVDITFNDYQNDLIVLGRTPVTGSPKLQMRHITPYAFLKQLIKLRVKTLPSPKQLLADLSKNIMVFMQDDKGICLVQTEYEKYGLKEDFYKIKMVTSKNTYYLISPQQTERLSLEIITAIAPYRPKLEKLYTERKSKFIKNAMQYLQKAIDDTNTYAIACESLARFIFTLFNQKPLISFPTEGNTLAYEIRLYNSADEAQEGKTSEFEVLTPYEVKNKMKVETLNYKIRIVYNEGALVKKTIKALNILDSIIFKFRQKIDYNSDLAQYNAKHNARLKLYKPYTLETKKYNKSLPKNQIKELLKYHIAKHLYLLFDFKPLEQEVFVPAKHPSKDQKSITVFLKAGNTTQYCIKKGKEYRQEQIKNAKHYNKQVVFRQEGKDTSLIAEKMIDHFKLSLLAFTYFLKGFGENEKNYPSLILNSFGEIVASAYGISIKEFTAHIEETDLWIKSQQGYISSDGSSESEHRETTWTTDGTQHNLDQNDYYYQLIG